MSHKQAVLAAPNLIITPTREITIEAPGPKLEGHYNVQLIRRGEVIQELNFKNLITNAGLDKMNYAAGAIRPTDGFKYLAVGTGNAAPVVVDISLQAPLSPRTENAQSVQDITGADGTAGFVYARRVRLFTELQVNGNLAELGFYSELVGGVLFNRQLFKDDLGNPVVVTKTNQDQLKITFEWRMVYPKADVLGVINLGGNNYDYIIRANGGLVDSFWGAGQGALFGFGGVGTMVTRAGENNALSATGALVHSLGSAADASSVTSVGYIAGTFYRDVVNIWDPGAANFASGVGMVSTFGTATPGHGPLFAIAFTPKIPKIATQRLTLNTRWSWGRV